ncbi:MAG: hypothetical protein FWD98_04605, partial [Defluviitaleaceae bacterium]|nr:hypothetical protein [Defluviitaleaceae bacterium]
MKIVKKRIAVILALVMLVSSVVPITPAYAFTPDSSVHLVRNPADPTPIVTGGVPSDTHLLHWPILMDTSYRMSYFITDNVQVVLTIFPSTTSGALEVFLDVLNNGVRTNAAHNNFSIHLDAESPFTTPDVFIESRPGVPGAMAYDWRLTYGGPTLYAGGQGDGGNRYNAGPPRSYITPMFWLTQGTGFSFRYNIPGLAEPVDFHIGWNLDGIPDADFVFSANGLRLGRIYEFNLETATNLPYNPDDPDWGNRRVQRVVRGIDLARVGVEPRSNYDDRDAYLHAAPGNSIAQPSPQVFTSGRVPRDAVIFMEDLERDKNPGSQGVSLELRIPVPDALHHPPDNVFTTAAALDLWEYEDIPLEMTIQIPGLSTTISIENILYSPGDDLVLLNESMPAGLQFIQPPHRTADGYIVFELANVDDENPVLLPSMWFGLLHISLHSPNQDIATPPPHDPQELNNAHTLLEYWPSAHGEEYYIVIRQFRSSPGGAIVHGNYHIFMHPTTGLPPPVNILTEGHIILPHNPNSDFVSGSTRINVMSPEDMSFRVLFVPFQPSTGTFGSMVDAIISQILRFIPLPGVAQIQTPETFNIVNSGPTVQPPHTPEALRADRDRGEVELQLSWDLGGQYSIRRMLEATDNDLELVYEIGHSLTHDFGTEVPFARLEFNITSGPGIGVDGVGIDWTNPPRWVPLPDGDSRVPQPSPLTPYNVRIRPHLGRYVLEVDFTAATYHNYFERTPSVDLRFPRFFYPNVYFLNVRPVYSNRVAVPDNVVASRFDSFTLSDISMPQVPVPQDLVIDNEQAHTPGVLNPDGTIGTHDQVSFDLRWQVSRTALRNFVRYAYRATPSALTANIYISADEDAMRDFVEGGYADQFKVDNGAPNGRFAGMPTAVFTPSGNHPDTLLPGMFFSDIDGHTAMTMYPPSSNDPRYYLRQTALPWGADIIRVTGVSLELTPELLGEINQWLTSPTAPASPPPFNFAFTLDGLDKGERYYVFVDFAVSFDNLYSEVGAATVEVVRDWFSMLSVLVGVTMPGDPDVPSGEDRVPTAPELFVGEVTSFSGEVYWPPIADADAEADPPLAVLQYEIIRIHNAQLDAAALQEIPTRSFQGFWEEHVADIAYSEPFLAPMGWRTYNLEEGVYTLREWGGDSFGAPIDLDDPRFYFTYTTGDVHGTELPVFMITDNTLRANELYFYYVRTVRRNSAGQYQYSVWSRISLTTTPIEPPINLRVAPETADFDPFTQIWLRFDAPMPMSSLSELGTPDGLRIELQVRREDDQWMDVRELDADTLRTVPSAPEVLLPDPATGF